MTCRRHKLREEIGVFDCWYQNSLYLKNFDTAKNSGSLQWQNHITDRLPGVYSLFKNIDKSSIGWITLVV